MGVCSSLEWKHVRRLTALAAVSMLAGCARYHARPLEPATTAAQFRSRSVTDPGLRSFAAAHRPAGAAWPPPTWDLESLAVVAFYYHPDLAAARARLGVAEAAIVTAGARPNPSVGATLRYNITTAGVPWTIPFTFDVPIETAGKRAARLARAEHLSDAARLALARATWTVRSGVRAALLEALVADRALALLRDEEAVRSEAARVLERRLTMGDVSRPEVDLAQIDLANTRLAVRAGEGRVEQSRIALAAALGVPASATDAMRLSWPGLDEPPVAESLTTAAMRRATVLNRLDVRQTLAEYAAAEAALRLEVARQYPDVHLGPGYVFEEGDNKFQIGFSVALPILNRNEGPIAEAEARRREAATAFTALQARVVTETDDALARYRSARAELGDADEALALLARREAAIRRALEVGEADRVTLVGVQVQRAVAARARLAALGKTQAALGALEDALERPLPAEAEGSR